MATQAQIEANRRNAQLSTGPKTDEGKAVVSRNALKHGLRAEDVLLPGEDAAEFMAFAEALLKDLCLVGPQQEILGERIVHLQWKMRRFARLEKEATLQVAGDGDLFKAMAADILSFGRGVRSKLALLQQYEMRLERSLASAKRELRLLQASTRRGGPKHTFIQAFRDGYNRAAYDLQGKWPPPETLEPSEKLWRQQEKDWRADEQSQFSRKPYDGPEFDTDDDDANDPDRKEGADA